MPSIDDLHEVLEHRARRRSGAGSDVGDVIRRARRRRRRHTATGAGGALVLACGVAALVLVLDGGDPTIAVNTDYADGSGRTPDTAAERDYSRELDDGTTLVVTRREHQRYGPFEARPTSPAEACSERLTVELHRAVAGVEHGDASTAVSVHPDGGPDGVTSVAFPAMLGLVPSSDPGDVRLVVAVTDAVDGATYSLVDGDDELDSAEADGPLLALEASRAFPPSSDRSAFLPLTESLVLQRTDPAGVTADLAVPAVRPEPVDSTECGPSVDEELLAGTAPTDRASAEAEIRELISGVASADPPLIVGGAPDGLPVITAPDPSSQLIVDIAAVHWVTPKMAWVEYSATVEPGGLPIPDIRGHAAGSLWVDVLLDGDRWKLSPEGVCAMAATLVAQACLR